MKKLLLIISLFAFASLAHAQQDVQSETVAAGTAGGNVTAPTWTNTAGNFLFGYFWVACTATNPNTPFAFTVNSGTPNHDSNGNVWTGSVDSQFTFTSTTRALYFFWTPSPAIAGAASITFKNATSDCKIDGGILSEYAGFFTFNPGSYRKNGNFMPFPTPAPDTNTSFPINASGTYIAASGSADLTVFVGIEEGSTGGTWTPNSGWAQVNSLSSTGFQMVQYDGTTGTAPSTISLNNSGSGFTQALGEWVTFNRTPPPNPGFQMAGYTSTVTSSNTISVTFPYVNGDLIHLIVANILAANLTPLTSSGCGSPSFIPQGSAGIGSLEPGWGFSTVLTGSGTCTITETTTGAAATHAMAVIDVSGMSPGSIDVYGVPPLHQTPHTCSAPYTTSENGDIIAGFAVSNENGGGGAFFSPNAGSLSQQNNVSIIVGAFGGTAGSAGSNTFTVNSSGQNVGGDVTCFVFPMRPTTPSTGFQQAALGAYGINTNVPSSTLALPWSIKGTANDHLRLLVVTQGGASPPPTVTSTPTLSCETRPTPMGNGNYLWNVDCPSVIGPTPVSVALAAASGTFLVDAFMWEQISGQFVAPSATLPDNNRTPVTLTDLGPLYLPQSATYYVESWLLTQGITDQGNETTPSSGYFTHIYGQGNGNGFFQLTGLYDQTSTTTSPTTFDNQVTTPTAIGGGGTFGGQNAWTATSYLYPIIQQAVYGNTTASIPGHIDDPATGCDLIVGADFDAASTSSWAISSTPSLSWGSPVTGGNGFNYSVWVATNVPAGVIDTNVTPTGTGNPALFIVEKVCGLDAYDSAVSTSAAGQDTGTITLPSVGVNQIVLGFAMNVGDGFFSQTYPVTPTYTSPISGNAAEDNATVNSFYALPPTSGAYTTSFHSPGSPTFTMGALLLFDIPAPPATEGGTVMTGNAAASGNGVQ